VFPPLIRLPLASGATPPVKPSFPTTALKVSIRAQGTDPGNAPAEVVHVSAGKYLLVQCPAASCTPDPATGTTCFPSGMEPFVKACDLQNWAWTTNNSSLLASFSLNVKPSDETPQTGEVSLRTWPVTFQSNGIEGNIVAASVGYLTTPPTSVGGTIQSPPQNLAPGYAGKMTIDLPGGTSYTTHVQARPTDYGDGITLFDPTYVLSPSGLMSVPLQYPDDGYHTDPVFKWYVTKFGPLGNTPTTKGVDGWLWAKKEFTRSLVFQQNTQDGSLSGSFRIQVEESGVVIPTGDTVRNEFTIHFELTPQAINACSSNSDCSEVDGYFCATGFCTQRAEEVVPSETFALYFIGVPWLKSSFYDDWYEPTVFSSRFYDANVLCQYDAGAGLATDAVVSLPVQEASGDLSCVSAANPGGTGSYPPPIFGVPLLVHKDLISSQINSRVFNPSSELSAQQLFDSCIADLAIKPPPLASLNIGGVPGVGGTFLYVADNFGVGRYFDSTRSCFAPGYFFSGTWNTAKLSAPTNGLGRLHMRLMQQWLEMHSFVGRQGLQTTELDGILAAAQSATPGGDPNLSVHRTTKSELIDTLTRGLAFVLSEFQGPNITVRPGVQYLPSPDYRQDFGAGVPLPSDHPEHEQPIGLPVTMLETASAYLDVVESLVKDVDVATYDAARKGGFVASRATALRTAGDAVRLATAFRDTAAYLHVQGCTPQTDACYVPPPWEPRWQQALQEFTATLTRVLSTLSGVAQAKNPLDIAENDVPLFFGDPQGATSQFFASSDYLLNTWAAPAVSTAQRDLAGARDAWITQQNSHLQDTLLETERDRRLEQLGEQYGGPIIENCGLSTYGGRAVEGKDVFGLVASGKINLNNCYLDTRPTCRPSTGHTSIPSTPNPPTFWGDLIVNGMTPVKTKSQLCVRYMLKARLDLPPEILDCANALATTDNGWEGNQNISINNGTVNCFDMQFQASELFRMGDLVSLDPASLTDAETACSKLMDFERLDIPAIQSNCMHGKMGEAYSQLLSAKEEVNTAMAAMAAKQVALDGEWNNCVELARDEDLRHQAEDIVDSYRDMYTKNRKAALDQQSSGDWWSAFSISGGSGGGSVGVNLGALIGAGSGEAVAAASIGESELLLDYQQLLQNQTRGEQMVACFNQADALKAEVDAARQVITARARAVNTAEVTLATLATQNVQQYNQGAAVLAREAQRPFAGYSHDYWLDDKITLYRRDLEWAKRLTYLAMRAVEYEFQESLNLRNTILSVTNADQLQAVVLTLQQEQAARTINRRRPEQQSLVLSLRDDILRIPSSTNVSAGERAWTAAQKFEGRLPHPQFTVRDRQGNWLGQGVEFALDPLAGGAQSGAALVNRCAERLWRVTATIQGDNLSTSQPGSPVFLLKRNTFQSQWCDGQGDGTAVQSASIQPSHALFSPSDVDASIDDATGHTGSALYPYFNVPRSQFYMSSYQTGSSDELAGRGLYGDYLLLFPKELIEAGFPLANVEDVLLRFDYYSIDNLPPLAQ
jgi:hypothetical protein